MIVCSKKEIFSVRVEVLWEVITNLKDASWRSDLSKIEVQDETHFVEYTSSGFPTYFEITEKKVYERYQFNLKNKNLYGTWIGTIEQFAPDKTVFTCKEELEVSNPLMKLLAPIYIKRQQKKYMLDLKRKLVEKI